MNPWLRRFLTIGLPLLATALLGWWFLSTYHRVPKELDLPARGEARYNPLLGLRKTLQAQGIEAISRADLNLAEMALKPGDTLLLNTDLRSIDETRAEALMSWVNDGGHLLLRLPEGGDEGRVGALLETLSLQVKEHFSCLNWNLPARPAAPADGAADAAAKDTAAAKDAGNAAAEAKPAQAAEKGSDKIVDKTTPKPGETRKDSKTGGYCSRYRFTTEAEYENDFEWLWGNSEDGFVFGRHPWGEGAVFIAADFSFFTNTELNDDANAALAWQVLGPALRDGRVFLVYATDVPPLYVLLVRHGWPVLLALALALAGWLWARSQRLGPLLPLASPNRRALFSHIQAAGEFAYARHRNAALHAAVLRAFQQRLRRRDPITAALSGEALVLALAQRHGLPAARIAQALQPQGLSKPDVFLSTLRTLMQLRAKT
jgi:hypothetical protein